MKILAVSKYPMVLADDGKVHMSIKVYFTDEFAAIQPDVMGILFLIICHE